MCLLINKGYMQSVAYHQKEVLEAGRLFAKTEGLVAAPETCHAIKAAVDIALKCKQTRESKIILFNYSGHGLLDLKAYEDYMEGKMVDFEATNETIKTSLATVPKAK
jgi:tryptophan synthase beta chain